MLKVVEAFSGIGAQAKALERLGIPFEIVKTIEWDINAVYAYDIIHNGKQNLEKYNNYSKDDLINVLSKYTLSQDGKQKMTDRSLYSKSIDSLKRICCALERTNDLGSIMDVKANDLPEGIDLLTYSFPCQDLSICGAWHNNMSGIDRNAHNRSGMLWEVERILKEYVEIGKKLPNFLLMENVSNILSDTHKKNFEEWQHYLEKIGYYNQIYTLNSKNFGIPQTRVRTYMISVFANDETTQNEIKEFFKDNNLQDNQNNNQIVMNDLKGYLRLDYTNPQYKKEADISNPNDTPSRRKIFENNLIISDGTKICNPFVKTITTKQDRNPNSGIILYESDKKNKSKYRNLTPRECFLLMGFDEGDFQKLLENDFISHGKKFFSREKLVKLAGNSIVVNVLEAIFTQINTINETIICKEGK